MIFALLYLLIALAVFLFKLERMIDFNRKIQRNYFKFKDLLKPLAIALLWLPTLVYYVYSMLRYKK